MIDKKKKNIIKMKNENNNLLNTTLYNILP